MNERAEEQVTPDCPRCHLMWDNCHCEPQSADVNNWDVLKVMSARGMDIGLAPLSNIERLNFVKRKGGTLVQIGYPGNILAKIVRGGYLGGLILADAEQYEQVRKELEEAALASGK